MTVRSDSADVKADLSLRWAHMPFDWFCHEAAQIRSAYRATASEIVGLLPDLIETNDLINPFMPWGLFHPCKLDWFITILGVADILFTIYYLLLNSLNPMQKTMEASDLSLHCLPLLGHITWDVMNYSSPAKLLESLLEMQQALILAGTCCYGCCPLAERKQWKNLQGVPQSKIASKTWHHKPWTHEQITSIATCTSSFFP